MAKTDETDPLEPDDDLSSRERILVDLHRAERSFGRDFARNDPVGRFFLERARINAVLEVGKALRRIDD